MRYIYCVLFGLLGFVISSFGEESIFKQIASAKTEFKITLNDVELEVAAQGLTLRAVRDRIVHNVSSDDKQINDIAYQAYHLEFAFEHKYRVRDGFEVVEFYDGNDVIHTISIESPSRKITTTNGRRYEANYMAINLEGVPLVMLDSVTRINFRRAK